jgi:hypothetical protein
MVQSAIDYLKKTPNKEGKRYAAMKQLTVILLFSTILFSKTLNQKMIIDVTTEPQSSTYILQEIQDFFQTNTIAKELKLNYHLTITRELLRGYDLIEIKPIHSVEVKNKLKLLLHEKYSELFIVDNILKGKSVTDFPVQQEIVQAKKEVRCINTIPETAQIKHQRSDFFANSIDEWLALILLAIVGLVLVYRSTKQISKIKKLQKKLEKYQNRLKTEVDLIGGQYE